MSDNDYNPAGRQVLIVGISRYDDPGITNLSYAAADATGMYRILSDPDLNAIPGNNISLLLDEQATRERVLSVFRSRCRQARENGSDFLFYFAGYGAQDLSEIKYSPAIARFFLIPADARHEDVTGSGISLKDFREVLSEAPPIPGALLLDCSFDGEPGGRSLPSVEVAAPQSATPLAEQWGIPFALLSACRLNQTALESPELGHGIFSHFLLEGLKGQADRDGDGQITLEELFTFVSAQVPPQAAKSGGEMQPVYNRQQPLLIVGRSSHQAAPSRADQAALLKELYQRARRAHQSGDTPALRDAVDEILRINPRDERALKIAELVRQKLQRRAAVENPAAEETAQAAHDDEVEAGAPEEMALPLTEEPEIEEGGEPEAVPAIVPEREPETETEPETTTAPPVEMVGESVEAPETPQEKAGAEEKPAAAPRKRRWLWGLLTVVLLAAALSLLWVNNLNHAESTLVFDAMGKANRPLRVEAAALSLDEVKEMLAAKGFYERDWNPSGRGMAHQYETALDNTVVIDYACKLMWQQGGSPDVMDYQGAKKYVERLNAEGFAGYRDWRLPTLEEAMSLVEKEKRNGDLNIAPHFGAVQRTIWTADAESRFRYWVVYFYDGYCYPNDGRFKSYYVRAVR